MVRWAALFTLLWSHLLLAADLPGSWVEVESFVSGANAVITNAKYSGGKAVMMHDTQNYVVLPITIDKAIERPRLYVRYSRAGGSPALVRLAIGPAEARGMKEAGVKTLADLSFPADADPGHPGYLSVILPPISAGKHTLFLYPLHEQEEINCDILGIVDRPEGGRWMPPSDVKDGHFTDAGKTGSGVRVDSFDLHAPVRLVYGGDNSPAVFDVSLTNATSDVAETETFAVFSNEAGLIATVAGPRVSLKGDETKSIQISATPPSYGLFWVAVTTAKDDAGTRPIRIGVLHRPAEGVRPNSLFGLNVGNSEQDLRAAEMVGVKWRRGLPLSFDPPVVAPKPGEWMDDKAADPVRAAIRKWKDAGILTLGLVNYNTTWNVAPGADGKPVDRWRNRPIDLNVQAEIEYRMFKALRDDVTYWEIWNEPWVHGWTWQTGTAQDYRTMSRLIWEKTKPELPEIQLICGGSTSYQRDVLFTPGNIDVGYADGCSTHPYNSPDRTMPSSAAIESILLKKYSKSGGKAGIWATEVGAPEFNFEAEPPEKRPSTAAKCVAPIFLLNRIGAGDTPIHVFYFTSEYGDAGNPFNMWLGKNPKPSLVAFSAMTHFLEDGQYQGDLYAASTAMWAPLFTKPDGTSVIAFWAEDGYSGRMRLPNNIFEAYDYLGAPIGQLMASGLAIDFTRWSTVYLVSRKPIDQVRAAMAAVRFEGFDSLRINPRSFTAPLDQLPPLRLKVQNLLPTTAAGEITVTAPPEIELAEPKQTISPLKSGEIRLLEFPLKKTTPNAVNRYPISYTATIGGQAQKGMQVVQAAYAPFGTPTIDGKLDDWAGVTPVTMLSRGGKDFLEATRSPDKAASILNAKTPGDTVAYRVWTRWDNENFYLAAEVPDEKLSLKAPATKDPFAFPFLNDNLQLAFDCLEPNPDDWFVTNPLREKCLGSEVDYEFCVACSQGGESELHRLKAPGTNYQTLYDTNVPLDPPLGLIKQGQAAITYDEQAKVLQYEVAIPWSCVKELGEQVKSLKPGQSHVGKFAFGVTDDAGRGKTFWTQEAGDLQSGAYGFSPSWAGGSVRCGGRILTDWGFVR
jgi:hypothetical protein